MAQVTSNKLECSIPTEAGLVVVCLEHQNREKRFSVTHLDHYELEHVTQSWGQFFSKEEAAMLHLWLGERLKELV